MNKENRNLTLRYGITQFSYWAASSGAVSFATTYLLDKGVPSGAVGLILAVAGLLSCITQPVLAAIADRSKHFLIHKMLLIMSALCALCFAVQLIPQLPITVIGLCYMACIWCSDAMVPLLNALCIACNEAGYAVNYGAARSVGAIATAVSAIVLGFILARFGPAWMLLFILGFRVANVFALVGYPRIHKPIAAKTVKPQRKSNSILRFVSSYQWFCASSVGVLFLGMYHAMTENYLIAIMQMLGGNSSHVGTALFISAMAAAPVIFFFSAIRGRIRDNSLLKVAALSYLLKSVLFYFAQSITILYMVQLIQITSYSFLVPTQMYYANEKVRKTDMVKGQAFITAAYALGCSGGNFAGGQLLRIGVDAILIAGIVMTVIGTIVMFLTVDKSDIPTEGNPDTKYCV